MSTYHVSLVVGQFKYYSTFLPSDILYKIWTRKELKEGAAYSTLVATPMAFDYLSQLTNCPYNVSKINKLEQVALPGFPNDESDGWGLPLYNEMDLLWFDEDSPIRYKQVIYEKVARALGRSWFANLQTCKWWSEVWLQEGLVTFFAYFITGLKPKWKYREQFIITKRHNLMELDSYSTLPPVALPEDAILTPSQIVQRLNAVTRVKGATVIATLNTLLGPNNFLKGIESLFAEDNEGMFNVATLDDFLGIWSYDNVKMFHKRDSFEGALQNQNLIKMFMRAWVTQQGFPVVHVAREEDTVVLTATKFDYNENRRNDSVWVIPIAGYTKYSDFYKLLMLSQRVVVNADLIDENDWVLVNTDAAAYIRVNYDPLLRKALNQVLKTNHKQIENTVERAQIVDDSFHLARAGLISYQECLDTVVYMYIETEYHPWYVTFREIEFLRWRFHYEDEILQRLAEFTQLIMTSLNKEVEKTSYSRRYLEVIRYEMARWWACYYQDEKCVTGAIDLFKRYLSTDTKVKPDSKSFIYCTGIRHSGPDDWIKFEKKMSKTKRPPEIEVMIEALGCTNDEEVLKRFLEEAMEPCHRYYAFLKLKSVITGSLKGAELGLNFVIDWAESAYKCLGVNNINDIFNLLAGRTTSESSVAKFRRFLQSEQNKELKQIGEATLRKMEENLEWSERMKGSVLKALKNYTLPKLPKKPRRSSAKPVFALRNVLACMLFEIINVT